MLVSRPPSPCRSAAQSPKSDILRLLKGPTARPKLSKRPSRMPQCLFHSGPEAFNTHRHDGRGSGLVQDVLRSLARIPAAEPRRRGLCAAPANVKRSTFPRLIGPRQLSRRPTFGQLSHLKGERPRPDAAFPRASGASSEFRYPDPWRRRIGPIGMPQRSVSDRVSRFRMETLRRHPSG